MEDILTELDALTGLDCVKNDVRSLMNFIRVAEIRRSRGLKVPVISYHLVFTGNPGTGKTTVARLIGRLYHKLGILPKGQLIEADRSVLVAGYVGQTALKTQEVIQKALGGILFIDEAYSLVGCDNDYGQEAIETILKAMEDHRDSLVVIVAGYDNLMQNFINSNPGLSSRFSKYFYFPDYNGQELYAILDGFCKRNGYSIDPAAHDKVLAHLIEQYNKRDEHFGNARAVRNLFEKAIHNQANRLSTHSELSDTDLELLTAEDLL